MQFCTTTLLPENISLFHTTACNLLCSSIPYFISPPSYALFNTLIYKHGCAQLQCLCKICIQQNQQLARSRLTHTAYAVFSCKALERDFQRLYGTA